MWARWVLGGMAAGFGWAVLELAGAAYERGSGYPEWSSLRADRAGTKVLHDSLRKLPGWRVERHFASNAKIPAMPGTVLLFNQEPEELERLTGTVERLTAGGARVVVGVPEQQRFVGKGERREAPAREWLGLRWTPRRTGEYIGGRYRETTRWEWEGVGDGTWWSGAGYAERTLGQGSVVVLDGGELRSGALREQRNGTRLLRLLGPERRVTFVESALGVKEPGGIMTLVRRAGWTPALLLLVAAAGLHLWRSVTPLLPEREDRTRREEPGGGAAAMAQLLRKHVGRGELLATCRREWKRAGGLLPRWQRQREWEAGTGGVVEEYRRMQEFVRERPEL